MLLILTMRFLISPEYFWFLYVPAVFLIASRYGVLLQLIHEASHGLLSTKRKTNDFVAKWLCASPIGVSFEGYVKGHMRHHAWTGTEKDPKSDTEKYKVVDATHWQLYLLFLKDLIGFTAIQVFFEYRDYEESPNAPKPSLFEKLSPLIRMSLCQIFILALLFQFDLRHYFLLWLVPAISPHMFLMRIRGIAEHGLSKQIEQQVTEAWQGSFYTRSFLTPENPYSFVLFTWVEKVLIGSLNAHYHHEHHLFPTVPFYHLPDLHKRISKQVSLLNPDVYAKGYFAAAFRSLRSAIPVQSLVRPLHSN